MTSPTDQRLEQLRKQAETLDRTVRFFELMKTEAPTFNVDQQPFLLMCEWYSRTGQRTTGHVQGFKNRSEQKVVWTAYDNRGNQYGIYTEWMELVENYFFQNDKRNQGIIVYQISQLKEIHRFGAIDGNEVQFPEDIPKDLKVNARTQRARNLNYNEVLAVK